MVDTQCAMIRVEDIYSSSALRLSQTAKRLGWRHSRNPSRAWVAKVQFVGDSVVRDFVRPVRDYSNANAQGTRGVVLGYILHPLIVYEVNVPTTTSKSIRYFCKVTDGKIQRITREEIINA